MMFRYWCGTITLYGDFDEIEKSKTEDIAGHERGKNNKEANRMVRLILAYTRLLFHVFYQQ